MQTIYAHVLQTSGAHSTAFPYAASLSPHLPAAKSTKFKEAAFHFAFRENSVK